jgi:hypothetical protein
MDYLFIKLIWWLAGAFALGLVAGWISCGEKKE